MHGAFEGGGANKYRGILDGIVKTCYALFSTAPLNCTYMIVDVYKYVIKVDSDSNRIILFFLREKDTKNDSRD